MNKRELSAKIGATKSIRNKRKANQTAAPDILKLNDIDHLIIRRDNSMIIAANRVLLYPATGAWRDLRSGETGRGIFGLISYLKSVRRMEESSPPSGEHPARLINLE